MVFAVDKDAFNVGTDWVDFITFEGGHEFCRDDAPIEKLIDDLSDLK